MTQESPSGSSSWVEQFRARFNPDRISERVARRQFDKLLRDRAANRAWYLAIPEEKFDERLGEGNSPRMDLEHHVGNALIRNVGLRTGVISSWDYRAVLSSERAEELQGLSRDDLIQRLDEATLALCTLLVANPGLSRRTIRAPFGVVTTGEGLLEDAMRHETGHAFAYSKYGDYFGIPRPAEMRAVWG